MWKTYCPECEGTVVTMRHNRQLCQNPDCKKSVHRSELPDIIKALESKKKGAPAKVKAEPAESASPVTQEVK